MSLGLGVGEFGAKFLLADWVVRFSGLIIKHWGVSLFFFAADRLSESFFELSNYRFGFVTSVE